MLLYCAGFAAGRDDAFVALCAHVVAAQPAAHERRRERDFTVAEAAGEAFARRDHGSGVITFA